MADTSNRLHAARSGVTVGKTCVANRIRDHQYARAAYMRAIKHCVPSPMPTNALWGIDLTFKHDQGGRCRPIFGVLDHGSRMAVVLRALKDKTAFTLLRALLDAIAAFGRPAVIRCDNESMFHAHLFRFSLAVLGISQQFTRLHHPWENGRVERLFGTLKLALDRVVVANFAALGGAMTEFRFFYNQVRPHQHLRGRTPQEVWDDGGRDVNPRHHAPKAVRYFRAWGGLLTGYYIRR